MSRIVVESSLKGKEKSLLDAAFPQGRLAVVCDPQTYAAQGRRIIEALPAGRCTEIILPQRPVPDITTLKTIRHQAEGCDAYIAVGSGTINDLCKRSSFLEEKPYAVFATAPSMNGYLSANASIYAEAGDIKESLPSAPPAWVWADLEVLAAAPVRLIRSGLGDSLCRSTAQLDWLMSHKLLETAYDPLPFLWLAEHEDALLHHVEKLVQGDIAAIERLFQTLIRSGQGMTQAFGSYPASQGEHMIAHAYEHLDHLKNAQPADILHGELIAITTLEMAALQARLLEEDNPSFHLPPIPQPATLFGDAAEPYRKAYLRKRAEMELWQAYMSRRWKNARQTLKSFAIPQVALKAVMETVGLATTPSQLGLDESLYESARRFAYATRDRFTFLDLEQMQRDQA